MKQFSLRYLVALSLFAFLCQHAQAQHIAGEAEPGTSNGSIRVSGTTHFSSAGWDITSKTVVVRVWQDGTDVFIFTKTDALKEDGCDDYYWDFEVSGLTPGETYNVVAEVQGNNGCDFETFAIAPSKTTAYTDDCSRPSDSPENP